MATAAQGCRIRMLPKIRRSLSNENEMKLHQSPYSSLKLPPGGVRKSFPRPHLCIGEIRLNRLSRRQALQTGLAGALGASAVPLIAQEMTASEQRETKEFSFHRDHVIGTSFDVWLQTSTKAEAERCELAMLDEIERLPARSSAPMTRPAKLNWLNRMAGPAPVSADAEVMEVLRGTRPGRAVHWGPSAPGWRHRPDLGRGPAERNVALMRAGWPRWLTGAIVPTG